MALCGFGVSGLVKKKGRCGVQHCGRTHSDLYLTYSALPDLVYTPTPDSPSYILNPLLYHLALSHRNSLCDLFEFVPYGVSRTDHPGDTPCHSGVHLWSCSSDLRYAVVPCCSKLKELLSPVICSVPLLLAVLLLYYFIVPSFLF